jgi:hypothetical protein
MSRTDQTMGVGAIRGRIGGVVYRHRKGDEGANVVQNYDGKVENPRTLAQLRNRCLFSCLSAICDAFSEVNWAYWKAEAKSSGKAMSARNAFYSYCLKQAKIGWMPQMARNPAHLSMPAAPTALAATVVDNAIVVTWTDAELAFTTGIHLGAAGGFTPSMRNLAYAVAVTGGEDRQGTILIAPGTYYIKARSGAIDGGVGAPTVSVGPVVIT